MKGSTTCKKASVLHPKYKTASNSYKTYAKLLKGANFRKFGTALKLITQVFDVAIKKYNVSKVEGTTYEDENGAPFKIYKKIGFKRIDDLFLIECDIDKVKSWFK